MNIGGKKWLVLLAAGAGLAMAVNAASTPPPVPPLPPLLASPMQFFRDLLATNAAGREAYLAGRTPAQKKLLDQKLAEYQALNPEQRELRLTMTELRYFLVNLLPLPKEMRTNYWPQLPAKYRPMLAERLRIWDVLSAENQAKLLDNESALSCLLRLEKAPLPPLPTAPPSLPPVRRRQIEEAMGLWNGISEAQRQTMVARFHRFFELSEREKRQTLETLPVSQRQNCEAFLAAFARLPKEQRAKCTAALGQFLSLAPAEQDQFLKNAVRWQAMRPADRQAVRAIIQEVPPLPPLPPGFIPGHTVGITGGLTNDPILR